MHAVSTGNGSVIILPDIDDDEEYAYNITSQT